MDFVTEKISLGCPHCGMTFWEKVERIRADATLPCPSCKQHIVFSSTSEHDAVR